MDEALQQRVLAIATRLLRERGGKLEADLDTPLAEDGLGLDSMARLELLSAIEKELGVDIPEEHWSTRRFNNLRGIVEVLQGLGG